MYEENLDQKLELVNHFLRGRMLEDVYMVIFCVKGEARRSKFFSNDQSDQAARYCLDMALKQWDVYFGQGLLKSPLESPSRGSETDVCVVNGLWFDGDLRGGAHSEVPEKLPTADELAEFFKDQIPFPPSQIVNSGGGRHFYWMFNTPFVIRSERDRPFIKTLSSSFQRTIIKKAKTRGWKQDNTSDLVRVLRVPHTFNHKRDEPVQVELLEDNGKRYSIDELFSWVEHNKEPDRGDRQTGSTEGLDAILEGCAFIRHCRDDAASLPEPDWWAMVCALCFGHEKTIHDLSLNYPGYSRSETEKKIQQAKKLTGPMTCKGVREKTGFNCPSGGCGVFCPAHLAGGRITWENPVLFNENEPPVFDVDLPGVLGLVVRSVKDAVEVPIELSLSVGLGVVSTVIHGKMVVQVKPGYREPVNLWMVCFLEPGTRKSSVNGIMTKPLTTWEAIQREKLSHEVKKIESENKSKEARLKSLRARYGKAKSDELRGIQDEILQLELSMEEVPAIKRLWLQDVTPEHVGVKLSENDGRISIISAEGGLFDILGGRYNGGVPNLDIFLQSHAGDAVRVDRGSRSPVILDDPSLTMILSPQPDVLRSLAEQKSFRGRGLLGRFAYFVPKSNLGYRTLETVPIEKDTIALWERFIHCLLKINPPKDDKGQVKPYVLRLEADAYGEWLSFSKSVEAEMREGARFEFMTDWAGKFPGLAIRIAGNLHCVRYALEPWGTNISLDTMKTAISLCRIIAGHAEIAYGVMGCDAAIEGAKKVWAWVESMRVESFTKRDCFNALKGRFTKIVDLEPCLDVLVERNYLAVFTRKTGGIT